MQTREKYWSYASNAAVAKGKQIFAMYCTNVVFMSNVCILPIGTY